MDKLHKLFMNLCLLILPAMDYIQCMDEEHDLSDYPICIEGNYLDGDRGKIIPYEKNTNTWCMSQCVSLQYRFTGTKGELCYCADGVWNKIESSTCDTKCPGDENEVCGGEERISLYKTLFQTTETTAKEVTTQPFTTYTRNMPTQTGSSTKTLITKESFLLVTTRKTFGNENVSPKGENKEGISTATAVYIALPLVIVMSGVIALVICLIVRRRRVKRVSRVSYHTSGSQYSSHTPASGSCNNLDNENLLEEHRHNKRSTTQLVSTAAGETRKSTADSGTEYSTILSAESPQRLHAYGCLKTQPDIVLTISSEYSHVTVTRTSSNSKITDNTYSHIGHDKLREHSIDNESERDSTYNSLQASPQKHGTDKSIRFERNHDTLYDHTKVVRGRNLKASKADEYEPFNSLETAKEIAGKGSSKGDKGSHVCVSFDSKETDLYEEAGHAYFILEPKK
ncbi:uncharacterized protein LOC123541402 [Mercenaria mercenaria]|uniref:uncharacterized protein LOC123541402 n=1 Tax=Mercenaria mercenaria TaxID=6596 RepID=UPI00234E4379|nr:uncharacterized protein LOC123541402 [Mercenaria mercenaria]